MKHFSFTLLVIMLLMSMPLLIAGELRRADKAYKERIRFEQENKHLQNPRSKFVEFSPLWFPNLICAEIKGA